MKILAINPLTPSRVPEIVRLDQLCLGGLWTAEGYLREIDSPNSTLLTLDLGQEEAGDNSNQMIGMACLWAIAEEAHITLLAVDPQYRRQGLGSILLLTLLEEAIARNLEWATLEVNVNNIQGINLYKKFGFIQVGIRKGYYQATGESAGILWLKGIQTDNFKNQLIQWQQKLIAQSHHNCYHWHKSPNC